MVQVTTIGLDLAKRIFHVVACDERGKEVRRKKLRRHQVLAFFAQQPACLVALEACASSSYWGREITKLGHQVKRIPPQFVKGYLAGNKNDFNDARALAEAATRPTVRTVAIKTEAQQDLQALHRMRELAVKHRTALGNHLRGLIGEYGITIPKGLKALRERLPELIDSNSLSPAFRALLQEGYDELSQLDARLKRHDQRINQQVQELEACQLLMTIPGFGPILASSFYSVIGEGNDFDRARDVSAAVGVVPKQHSSGDKTCLLGISKRGNARLRYLLVHGARAVVRAAARKRDPLSCWINALHQRRGYNKASVALANKMARMGWAVLQSGEPYRRAVVAV